MNRVLFPLFLIAISIVAFFVWINPQYNAVMARKDVLNDTKKALASMDQLKTERARLIGLENKFSKADLDKLQKFLPDNVDNIRFFLDVQGVASRYNTSIQDISVGDNGQKTTTNTKAIIASNKQYDQMTLSFSITTSYENLNLFLKDLENSLRLVEIKSISFTADNKTPNRYKVSVGVNAFWLNSKTK